MAAKSRVLDLASGLHRRIPADLENVVGIASDGRIVVDSFDAFNGSESEVAGHTMRPFLFGLTLCCNAYDKGVEDGVVCRRCYSYDDSGDYYFRDPDGSWTTALACIDFVVGTPWANPKEESTTMSEKTEKSEKSEKAPAARKGRKTPAAEQFHALGLTDEKAWTPTMLLAVKQRWSGLPVDQKVADLRAALAAVEVAAVPSVDEMVAEAVSLGGTDNDATRDKATTEHKRLKRNAAVNAWRERNQIQAALDARDLKFRALRSAKKSA